jgi:GntR family transcriptional regulator
MYIRLDPNSGTPLHLQIKEQVRLALATGVLHPGDQLPTVRDLAADLRINPNTIARVYRDLQAEGLILSRQGSGSFVSEGARTLVDAQTPELVRSRMRGVVALGLSVGLSHDDLADAFAETIDEAKAAGVVGRTEPWAGKSARPTAREGS